MNAKYLIFAESEVNNSPTMFNNSPSPDGVGNRLQQQQTDPVYNQKDIDTLRSESALNRLGKIEQLAVAEKLVEDNLKVYKKSAFATNFAKIVQQIKKPK